MELIRSIFYLIFIIICFVVLGIIQFLQNQNECECNTGWKPENIKLISQVGIFIGIINILIPMNKTLYNIPIISAIFSILMLCIILMYIFTMVRYFRNLKTIEKCRNTCKIKKTDETFINVISNTNTFNIVIIALLICICMLYL
jgi:hypothetical protein